MRASFQLPWRNFECSHVKKKVLFFEWRGTDFAQPDASSSTLAITDEEKLKLAALLRDLDSGDSSDPDPGYSLGYSLDAEACRCLADIDDKLKVQSQ